MKYKLRRRPLGDISLLAGVDIPPLLKRLYVQRGIKSSSSLERSLRALLPYWLLTGIDHAVDLLVQGLIDQRNLMVIGDFDADGATSTALMVLALRQMGANSVAFIVPNRFHDSYGLSPTVVAQAAARGAQIIITVDNGIMSHTAVDLAHKQGILVLITDHHLPGEQLPNADAIVNPNLLGCNFPSKALAGVGVAFYLMLALRARLNKCGWFDQHGIAVPNLATLLDLVAIGTVADMVSMDANNRILVYQGICRIRAGCCRPGILALAEVANRKLSWLCVRDLGFVLAPRLNAVGRLADMSVGIMLLLTENILHARRLAAQVNYLNTTRRKIEYEMTIKALKQLARSDKQFGIVIYDAEWHQGLIGILASRIKERFNCPVIAFAPAMDGILKGSGRSIAGLNMYHLLDTLNTCYPGMIVNFGGHSMAVGLTIELTQLMLFRQRFTQVMHDFFKSSVLVENIILSDGELVGNELSLINAEILRNGGPWGPDFPYPLFDGKFVVVNKQIVGDKHLKLILSPLLGGPLLDGIAFNIDLNLWTKKSFKIVRVAYYLDINYIGNKSYVKLTIQHVWPIK